MIVGTVGRPTVRMITIPKSLGNIRVPAAKLCCRFHLVEASDRRGAPDSSPRGGEVVAKSFVFWRSMVMEDVALLLLLPLLPLCQDPIPGA
jgi:hypothetical protein